MGGFSLVCFITETAAGERNYLAADVRMLIMKLCSVKLKKKVSINPGNGHKALLTSS